MTIEQLQAMSDEELNALAAKLRGWTIGKSQPWTEGDWRVRYCDVYNESDGAVIPVDNWTPATSRDQSGALLEWAVAHGVESKINIGSEPYIEITWPDAPENLHSLNGADWIEILGSDARSQTIAFCAAMLAIEGGSK